MFAKSRRVPIQVDTKQILWPMGHHKTQLEKTQDLLEKGHMVFRYLSEEEEIIFRALARSKYEPFAPIEGIWHPVYQDECVRMNHELSFYRKPKEEETNSHNEV